MREIIPWSIPNLADTIEFDIILSRFVQGCFDAEYDDESKLEQLTNEFLNNPIFQDKIGDLFARRKSHFQLELNKHALSINLSRKN